MSLIFINYNTLLKAMNTFFKKYFVLYEPFLLVNTIHVMWSKWRLFTSKTKMNRMLPDPLHIWLQEFVSFKRNASFICFRWPDLSRALQMWFHSWKLQRMSSRYSAIWTSRTSGPVTCGNHWHWLKYQQTAWSVVVGIMTSGFQMRKNGLTGYGDKC